MGAWAGLGSCAASADMLTRQTPPGWFRSSTVPPAEGEEEPASTAGCRALTSGSVGAPATGRAQGADVVGAAAPAGRAPALEGGGGGVRAGRAAAAFAGAVFARLAAGEAAAGGGGGEVVDTLWEPVIVGRGAKRGGGGDSMLTACPSVTPTPDCVPPSPPSPGVSSKPAAQVMLPCDAADAGPPAVAGVARAWAPVGSRTASPADAEAAVPIGRELGPRPPRSVPPVFPVGMGFRSGPRPVTGTDPGVGAGVATGVGEGATRGVGDGTGEGLGPDGVGVGLGLGFGPAGVGVGFGDDPPKGFLSGPDPPDMGAGVGEGLGEGDGPGRVWG